MNFNNRLIIGMLLGIGVHVYSTVIAGKIQIFCTAALIQSDFERREKEYSHSLEIIKSYGYEPYIVEAIFPKGPTFLHNYSQHICYSNVNNAALRNKGVNEARSMTVGLQCFNFADDDMVVKLSGRYYFTSDYFVKYIENHPDVDACIISPNSYGFTPTACFALRCKYFKEMLAGLDLERMERNMINIEAELVVYVQKLQRLGMKVAYLPRMEVAGSVYGNPGNAQTPWAM